MKIKKVKQIKMKMKIKILVIKQKKFRMRHHKSMRIKMINSRKIKSKKLYAILENKRLKKVILNQNNF